MNAMIGLQGMTCQGCVQGVQGVLDRMDGVIGAEVTLEPQQALVRFDAERISLDAIRAGIEDVGYEVMDARLEGSTEQRGVAGD